MQKNKYWKELQNQSEGDHIDVNVLRLYNTITLILFTTETKQDHWKTTMHINKETQIFILETLQDKKTY